MIHTLVSSPPLTNFSFLSFSLPSVPSHSSLLCFPLSLLRLSLSPSFAFLSPLYPSPPSRSSLPRFPLSLLRLYLSLASLSLPCFSFSFLRLPLSLASLSPSFISSPPLRDGDDGRRAYRAGECLSCWSETLERLPQDGFPGAATASPGSESILGGGGGGGRGRKEMGGGEEKGREARRRREGREGGMKW